MAEKKETKRKSLAKFEHFQIKFGDWLREQNKISRMIITFIFALVLAFLIIPDSMMMNYPVSESDVGTVLKHSVRANRDYIILDEAKTRQNRIKAQSQVPLHFQTVDVSTSERNISRSFSHMRNVAREFVLKKIEEKAVDIPQEFSELYLFALFSSPKLLDQMPYRAEIIEQFEKEKSQFDRMVGFPVNYEMFLALAENMFHSDIEKAVVEILSRLNAYNITRDGIPEDYPLPHISVRKGDTTISIPTSKVITGKSLHEEIKHSQKILQQDSVFSQQGLHLIALFTFWAIRDNIVFSSELTEAKKLEAWNNAPREEFRIKNGEIIRRSGEMITERDVMIFREIVKHSSDRSFFSTYLYNLFYILFSIVVIFFAFKKSVSKFRFKNKDILLMGLQTLFLLLIFDLIVALSVPFSQYMGSIDARIFYFLVPVPFVVATVRLLINTETAVFYCAVLHMLFLLLFPGNYYFPSFYFIGSMAYLFLVTHIEKRGNILKVSFFLSLILLFLTLFIFVMDTTLPADNIPRAVLLTFFGAMLSAMLLMAVIPLYEWLFAYTTDITFLEYSTLNHPLMKQMAVYANGTYQHSLTVGSIVEVAARDIGLSPLACKVMAYFHDIGKLERPQYFTENQSGKNLHDKVPSHSMSAMIIINHVKHGLDLARKYRLGEKIEDAVSQHHGSTLVEYFYISAKKEDPSISESTYRYPGPKPQTRETALLMLADSIEASVRAISDKSFQKISETVEKIIRKKLEEDQFSECPMTLKDLKKIEESCIKTLSGIYHARVEYPDK